MNKCFFFLALASFSVQFDRGTAFTVLVTYVPAGSRQAELERLLAIETPSEQQYLTSVARPKFSRDNLSAQGTADSDVETGQIESQLRTEGFILRIFIKFSGNFMRASSR